MANGFEDVVAETEEQQKTLPPIDPEQALQEQRMRDAAARVAYTSNDPNDFEMVADPRGGTVSIASADAIEKELLGAQLGTGSAQGPSWYDLAGDEIDKFQQARKNTSEHISMWDLTMSGAVVPDTYETVPFPTPEMRRLQRDLTLAGYMPLSHWQHMKRHNSRGIPDNQTQHYLADLMEDADIAGMTWQELLAIKVADASMDQLKKASAPKFVAPTFRRLADETVQEHIQSAFQEAIGRDANKKELSRFTAAFRSAESASYGQTVGAAKAAHYGKGGGTVTDAPSPSILARNKLRGTFKEREYRAMDLGQDLRAILRSG